MVDTLKKIKAILDYEIKFLEESDKKSYPLNFDIDDLGIDYVVSLNEVLKVRTERRLKYEDKYLFDSYEFLKDQIKNKLARLELNSMQSNSDLIYENEKDNLIDIINYSIFYLSKLRVKK